MTYYEESDYNSGREYSEGMAGRHIERIEAQYDKQIEALRSKIAALELRAASAEKGRDEAKDEAAARLKQFLTQVEMHNRNTKEWRKALDEALALAELRRVALEEANKFLHSDYCGQHECHPACKAVIAVLAQTGPDALEAVRRAAKVEGLREAVSIIHQTTPECVNQLNDREFGRFEGRLYAIEQIDGEAERLASATEGKENGR